MPVKIRKPSISITLQKTVGRSTIDGAVPVSERFAGQRRSIDLTPFLGEQGSVTVSKSVRDPAGSFSIVLTDRISIEEGDSLYGVVEPMDLIEIRMAADAYKTPTQLPIMMRGFVSEVRRSNMMQANGQPQRRITISGQDYGKIWQILQIFFMPNAPESDNLITSFPFFARFGLTFNVIPADQFVREVFQKIVNPYIRGIAAQSSDPNSSPLLDILSDTQIEDGTVSPFQYGDWQGGSVHDLLTQNCDIGAWNELFIEDRSDAPYVVFRQNPFLAAGTNDPLHANSKPVEMLKITRDDVISIDVTRSDSNVANYYWVAAPRYALNYEETLRAFAFQGDPNSFFIQDYGNVNPKLYGTRKMLEQTNEGSRDEKTVGNGTPAGAARTKDQSSLTGWITYRRESLISQNKDNVVFEQGSIRLKGNDAIRAGKYLQFENGNMNSLYYCVSVTHTYAPFQSYTTDVNFERGTGFIDRARQEAGVSSPYYSELTQK